MRLLEPLGLIDGEAARLAVGAGHAVPLAGGPAAFCFVRTLTGDGDSAGLVPVGAIPAQHLAPFVDPRPAWAGLTNGHPLVMGILNATPDSFSDGGAYPTAEVAIAAGRSMLTAGVDIIDIGGESTRPGAEPTSPAEEQRRIVPVIRALAAAGAVISADTRNADTMEAALDAGARIVNDVSALTHDPRAAAVVAGRACPVVLMHMRGTPRTMAALAGYADVAADVTRELAERVARAMAAGVDRRMMAIDPGFGFAKSVDDSIALLRRLAVLHNLGLPIVAGVSRKGFIGALSGQADAARRMPGSLAAGLAALRQGASILRVHDVAATVQAVRVWSALAADAR